MAFPVLREQGAGVDFSVGNDRPGIGLGSSFPVVLHGPSFGRVYFAIRGTKKYSA